MREENGLERHEPVLSDAERLQSGAGVQHEVSHQEEASAAVVLLQRAAPNRPSPPADRGEGAPPPNCPCRRKAAIIGIDTPTLSDRLH
jgi:hypothetical protein